MKLAGVVILYHPDEKVVFNIFSYLDGLDILYVIDNTEDPAKYVAEQLKGHSNVEYIAFGENKGISYALNYVIARCPQYEYLLTMDQDSSFVPGDIEKYKTKVNLLRDPEIAVYGVRFGDEQDEEKPDKYVKAVITSGSIINLNLAKKLGGFDEKLFIDCVDSSYCYNAAEHGYKILEMGDIILNHRLGEPTVRRFLWKKYKRNEHNAIRTYYITRNNIYLVKKYKGKRNFARFRDVMKAPWGIIFWEDSKISKINAWLHGLKDGILENMGKCNRRF